MGLKMLEKVHSTTDLKLGLEGILLGKHEFNVPFAQPHDHIEKVANYLQTILIVQNNFQKGLH